MPEFIDLFRRPQDNNGNNNEVKYDPRCGVNKVVFEWRCRQQERVDNRMPVATRKMRVLTQKMRSNFQNDPEGLKRWEDYEKSVLRAYERNLPISLTSPAIAPHTVLYKDLMRRTAHSKTALGMLSGQWDKLKQATKNCRFAGAGAIAVVAATAGLAVGLAVGPSKAARDQEA